MSTGCLAHGLTLCTICFTAKQAQIIACTHKWYAFSDAAAIGTACDFNSPVHIAIATPTSIVHICEWCQAVACAACYVGG